VVPTNKQMDLPPDLEIPDLAAYYTDRINGVKAPKDEAGNGDIAEGSLGDPFDTE
jgi:hypothetical protein